IIPAFLAHGGEREDPLNQPTDRRIWLRYGCSEASRRWRKLFNSWSSLSFCFLSSEPHSSTTWPIERPSGVLSARPIMRTAQTQTARVKRNGSQATTRETNHGTLSCDGRAAMVTPLP